MLLIFNLNYAHLLNALSSYLFILKLRCSALSIFKSYVTLFWSLFGLTQLSTVREGDTQPFTKRVGEYLLMVYHTMAVIVLINMLIAMMSNSFQEIEVTTLLLHVVWSE